MRAVVDEGDALIKIRGKPAAGLDAQLACINRQRPALFRQRQRRARRTQRIGGEDIVFGIHQLPRAVPALFHDQRRGFKRPGCRNAAQGKSGGIAAQCAQGIKLCLCRRRGLAAAQNQHALFLHSAPPVALDQRLHGNVDTVPHFHVPVGQRQLSICQRTDVATPRDPKDDIRERQRPAAGGERRRAGSAAIDHQNIIAADLNVTVPLHTAAKNIPLDQQIAALNGRIVRQAAVTDVLRTAAVDGRIVRRAHDGLRAAADGRIARHGAALDGLRAAADDRIVRRAAFRDDLAAAADDRPVRRAVPEFLPAAAVDDRLVRRAVLPDVLRAAVVDGGAGRRAVLPDVLLAAVVDDGAGGIAAG